MQMEMRKESRTPYSTSNKLNLERISYISNQKLNQKTPIQVVKKKRDLSCSASEAGVSQLATEKRHRFVKAGTEECIS